MVRVVTLKDKDPLEISEADVASGSVWVCRCGLSAKWPYCDSSHASARREKPGVVYKHRRDEPRGKIASEEGLPHDAAEADPRPDA